MLDCQNQEKSSNMANNTFKIETQIYSRPRWKWTAFSVHRFSRVRTLQSRTKEVDNLIGDTIRGSHIVQGEMLVEHSGPIRKIER